MQTPTDKDLFDLIKETYPLNPRTDFVFDTEVELREAARKLNRKRSFKRIIGVRKEKSEPQKRRIKNLFITVAMSIALVFGISFISPAFANTFKSIPIIGSIFKIIGDKGLQEAEKSGLSKKTNKSISVGDSSFMITDVIYDGSRLSLGYILRNYPKSDDFYDSQNVTFKIDKKNFNWGGNINGEFINDTDYAGVINLVPEKREKNSFDLSISIKEFNGKKGNWHLNIPVSKITGKSFLVTKQAFYNDYTITMKKVTFTPTTTEINFDVTEPVGRSITTGTTFRLYDDKGKELKGMSTTSFGLDRKGKRTENIIVQYEPIKTIPDYIIFKGYFGDSKVEMEGLRMKIPPSKI